MALGMEEGLSSGDFVLDGVPAPPPEKGGAAPPQFSAHVYCDQTAGWMKTPLGREVDLGSGHIVSALRERGTANRPLFWPMSIVATMHPAVWPQ